MSGGTGKPTGVDVEDDLKDFHAALAVQATSQQIVEYNLMLKSTEAASTALQGFLAQLSNASGLAGRDVTLEQALEKARAENKKFLDGLSDPQRSGLKEITKRLAKSESDLGEQAKALNEKVVDAKAAGPPMAGTARSLERALASFRSQQGELGEEMSILLPGNGQDSTFNLPPVRNVINLANQSIAITASGVISKGVAEEGRNRFKFELTADLSDLQRNITEVLHAQLDEANRCGERIEIQNAVLTPVAPASLVVVQLHFERWTCFGRTMNEMAEGNGTIEVKLRPAVGQDGEVQLVPEIERIDAAGVVGDWLRSDSGGKALRDKIAEAVLSTVRQGGDLKAVLPPTAQGNTTLQRTQFQGTGSGKLMVVMAGEIQVSNEQVPAFISELKGRSASREAIQETKSR